MFTFLEKYANVLDLLKGFLWNVGANLNSADIMQIENSGCVLETWRALWQRHKCDSSISVYTTSLGFSECNYCDVSDSVSLSVSHWERMLF